MLRPDYASLADLSVYLHVICERMSSEYQRAVGPTDFYLFLSTIMHKSPVLCCAVLCCAVLSYSTQSTEREGSVWWASGCGTNTPGPDQSG